MPRPWLAREAKYDTFVDFAMLGVMICHLFCLLGPASLHPVDNNTELYCTVRSTCNSEVKQDFHGRAGLTPHGQDNPIMRARTSFSVARSSVRLALFTRVAAEEQEQLLS